MVEVLADMPPGTLGFRISGSLSREDYVRALVPPLDEAVGHGEKLRVLYEIDKGFGMQPGAMWEDVKLEGRLGIAHRDAWDRIAVVSDIDWIWRAMELFSWMVPGEMNLYHETDLELAKRWLAAPGA